MYTLGINAAFHDSAAAILLDGKVLAAAEEERFTKIKHGKRPSPFTTYMLPFHAIQYCLKEAGIKWKQLDKIAYSFDPFILRTEGSGAQQSNSVYGEQDGIFLEAIEKAVEFLKSDYPHHLRADFMEMGNLKEKWMFVAHHLAHAASAYYCSGYTKAAICVMDGRGETASTSFYMAEQEVMRQLGEVSHPHSFGFLFEKLTTYLGFLHASDEYKVMALSGLGKPVYLEQLKSMIQVNEGDYSIQPFDLVKMFGPARKPGEPLQLVHYDLACSFQLALEDAVLRLMKWLKKTTKSTHLCLAGGVFLNCLLNSKIFCTGDWQEIFIQPAAGDAGTAIGAAQIAYLRSDKGTAKQLVPLENVYLGPHFTEAYIEKVLADNKIKYTKLFNDFNTVVNLLQKDKIVGWFQGRMEFGPRALGMRSILASPVNPDMQSRLNALKDREEFRPVAPVIMEEKFHEWFDGPFPTRYMLYIHQVKRSKRGEIPSAIHTDGTARVQSLRHEDNLHLYNLIKDFYSITGIPLLINTSFNSKGEPIVATPEQALACFYTTPLDALVLGDYLIEK